MKTEAEYFADISKRVRYEDGVLYWVSTINKCKVGTRVGTPDALGYMRLRQRGRMLSCHRLIFFMFHGWLPENVDHIDGDNRNNRIENLRAATVCQNMRNCKTPITNTSGVKGVYLHKQLGKWTASIRIDKKLAHLGTFTTIFDAACARKSAEIKYYGEFAR